MLRIRSVQQALEKRRVALSSGGGPIERARTFLSECWSELKMVQKPTWDELKSHSLAVLLVVVLSASYLAVLDYVLGFIFRLFRPGG
ncbi:MAG: preprotein translocase subunit SecE [Armatimonadetes bacterium]|nr:preprotein translocase subunit SecE [Armatimonadota bacterium]MDW8122855.1 preprotein translocase subunit SecE [Armatimonadota bacterium]